MEKELVELFDAAKKAADAAAAEGGDSEDENRCLDALQELKNFPVHYQILVNTQVGKRLRSLTKHPRKKIQVFAVDLIEIWKKIIIDETQRNKANGNSDTKPSAAAAGRSNSFKAETMKRQPENLKPNKSEQLDSPRPAKMVKSEDGNSSFKSDRSSSSSDMGAVKVERISKQDQRPQQQQSTTASARRPGEGGGVSSSGPPKLPAMVKCNDAMRDKIRELLHEALARVPNEVDESIRDEVEACDPVRVAVSVESVMYEKWGKSSGTQKMKYRSIMFNIKDQHNPDFRRKVLMGVIKPERIPTLTPEEMASEQLKIKNQQIKEKALFECERAGAPKATTDQFKCGRCGQRKCTYYQMQTRSADEPMTTFVTCVNCNNHWKFC